LKDKTSANTEKDGKQPVSAAWYLLLAAWWALFAGLFEVAILAARHLKIPIMKLGPDYLWTAPLTLVGVFLMPGLFFFLTGRLLSKMDLRPATTFCCSVLAFMNLLILVPRLHHLGSLVFALGIATQITNYTRKHDEAFTGIVRRTLPWAVALVAILGVGISLQRFLSERQALAALPAATAGAPNVVIITLDTVGARNLGMYGHRRNTSPHLDALAGTAVVFDNAFSTASWTLPSHASMFTGRWHHELSSDYAAPLDDAYPTLAEFLSARGYQAAGFVANLGYTSAETGLARGFSHYEDYPISVGQAASSSTLVRTIADNFRLRTLLQNDQHLNRKTADQVNTEALRWLDRERSRPFFLFLNYFDAHDPYLPPAPFDTRFGPGRKQGRHSPLHHWLYNPVDGSADFDKSSIPEEIDAYDGAIGYLDDRLNELFDSLKQRGLWDNTLLIITADHGEEFGEHRVFEHGYSLYFPAIHVPLLVSFPGRVPAAKRIQTPVSLRDLPATVVELLDVREGAPFPGVSLVRYWQTSTTPGVPLDRPVLSEVTRVSRQRDWYPVSKGDMKSVVFRNLHYIRNGDGSEELYDYSQDPLEQTNLAPSLNHSDVLEQFRVHLKEVAGK
jgi:arylsulfatase A-like enzyme